MQLPEGKPHHRKLIKMKMQNIMSLMKGQDKIPEKQLNEVASLVAQLVKNLPAMQETWVQPLGWEDPLEKGKATHSSILTWKIP